MKYTWEQRLDITKRIYNGELTVEEAAVKYQPNPSNMKGYLRLYHAETGLPPRTHRKKTGNVTQPTWDSKNPSFKEYKSISKEDLIDALVMARINEARLKKDYSVKGSGVEKEYLPIDNGNIK